MEDLDQGDFTDVLRALDVKALDSLNDCLRAEKCLHAARLAFRALRDAVDAGMREVRLTLGNAKDEHTEILQYPSPLRRWPRCSSVTVSSDGLYGGSLTPELAAWPFQGLSTSNLQCITQLKIVGAGMDSSLIGSLLATACTFPSLRQLILSATVRHDSAYVPDANVERMYDALAQSCPQLEHLVMPARTELRGIGALAGSLQKLELWQPECRNDLPATFQQGTASAIAELRQLKELRLRNWEFRESERRGDGDVHGLVLFLNSLPPSVQEVQLQDARLYKKGPYSHLVSIGARLRDSRIHCVVLFEACTEWYGIDFMSSLMLQVHALGPTLPVLEIASTLFPCKDSLFNLPTSQPSFHQLLQRTERVDVHKLILLSRKVECGEPKEVARQVVQLYGVPRMLEMYDAPISLQLRGGQTEADRPRGTAAAGPTNAGLQNEVLEAFCRGFSGDEADAPGSLDAVVKEVLEVAIDRSRGDGSYSVVLLLRGAPLSAVGKGAALSDWLQKLSHRAETVAASIVGHSRCVSTPISYYLEFPAVSDVILQCRSDVAATAIALAVKRFAAYESIEATMLSDAGFYVGGALGELWRRLSEVVQELYDSSEGSETERLERLVALADRLRVAVQQHHWSL